MRSSVARSRHKAIGIGGRTPRERLVRRYSYTGMRIFCHSRQPENGLNASLMQKSSQWRGSAIFPRWRIQSVLFGFGELLVRTLARCLKWCSKSAFPTDRFTQFDIPAQVRDIHPRAVHQGYGEMTLNSVFANPHFVQPSSGDFHSRPDTPARQGLNLGPEVAGSQNLDGHPRTDSGRLDMGCYQAPD